MPAKYLFLKTTRADLTNLIKPQRSRRSRLKSNCDMSTPNSSIVTNYVERAASNQMRNPDATRSETKAAPDTGAKLKRSIHGANQMGHVAAQLRKDHLTCDS